MLLPIKTKTGITSGHTCFLSIAQCGSIVQSFAYSTRCEDCTIACLADALCLICFIRIAIWPLPIQTAKTPQTTPRIATSAQNATTESFHRRKCLRNMCASDQFGTIPRNGHAVATQCLEENCNADSTQLKHQTSPHRFP